MERMNDGTRRHIVAQLKNGLATLIECVLWELRRSGRNMTRQFGVWGWALLITAGVGLTAWSIEQKQMLTADALQKQLTVQLIKRAQVSVPAGPVNGVDGTDGRTRLKVFQDHLLPHDDIPVVLQELLHLAEKEGLVIQRGEYRPQVDTAGRFLRYRMILPVKGDANAIQRFMQAALRAQKTLALENVQFKRERIESAVIEARIQWVMLTSLPNHQVASGMTENTVAGDPR